SKIEHYNNHNKMKRVQTNKATRKVALRKRITYNISETLQRGECSQNTVSQASQVSINGDDSGESLQENFSDSESLLSDKSQHTNDLEYNSSMTSDTSSSSDQLSVTEEIELQTEEEKNFNQIIVDSGIDFQPIPGEYGPYFKNFTEMSFFTWVTQHMI
ncbi:5992_t:CDS:1, partial [Cetraspora pellucida]